jgi:low density lipoprotein receptor-related protein 5/6
MYWVDNGGGTDKLCRANMDGTNIEVILYGAEARSIALDLENDKIYWTRVQGGGVGTRSIKRANLNGTNVETVVGGLGTPDDIALDLEYGKMYWTDQSTHKVQRANLNGTSIEDLVVTGLDRPYGIALDLVNRNMYWVDWGTKKIQRANMDGTNVEDLVMSGLVQPLYITLLPGQALNTPPIAHAAEDKEVYAWIDGWAEVQLDGTGSYDPDGDDLEYYWFDTDELIATGAEPNVVLPIGEHVIDLIVNDGTEDSEPNSCVVTVIEAVEMEAKLTPHRLNRKSNRPHVIGRLELPGLTVTDLAPNEMMVLMPGNIEAERMDILGSKGKKDLITLIGFFDNAALIEAIIEDGDVEVIIAAKLISGQWVYGRDVVKVK